MKLAHLIHVIKQEPKPAGLFPRRWTRDQRQAGAVPKLSRLTDLVRATSPSARTACVRVQAEADDYSCEDACYKAAEIVNQYVFSNDSLFIRFPYSLTGV